MSAAIPNTSNPSSRHPCDVHAPRGLSHTKEERRWRTRPDPFQGVLGGGDRAPAAGRSRGRLRATTIIEWLAERAIFEMENVNATGMARNQAVHEYLTYGMPLTVDGPPGRDTRNVRFFDFDCPEGGLNEYVVTTQLRVRRGNDRGGPEDDERLVIPDLALFGNEMPLVVMEAKSPEHFKTKVRANGFKAQVVAPSRAAALRYAQHLNSFGVRAYPFITAAPNDGPEFKEARELDQEQVVSAFVDPQGEPEVLVVVDMLLTGFDAPVEQALYLDRALREHGLLQAIARVNSRFSHVHNGVETEKTYGLVVDYHGVSRDLEEALSTFDWPHVQDKRERARGGPSPGHWGGRRPGGVPLQGPRPERHLGMRRPLRSRRLHRGRLQGRPVRGVIGGGKVDHVGGSTADIWRLKSVPSSAIHRFEVEPMDGGMDVSSGRVSAGPQGGNGRRHEHPGGVAGVRAALGHGAQDGRLLRAVGLPGA